MITFNLKTLHDSILISIEFDWIVKKSTVKLDLNEAYYKLNSQAVITAFNTEYLECSNMAPWGKSNFVNNIKIDERQGKKIEIELQSGDVIIIHAENFEIKVLSSHS